MSEDTVHRAIYGHLSGSTGLTALVGTRIRPFRTLKQDEDQPAVVFSRISADRFPGYGGEADHVRVILQVDCYANGRLECLDVAEQVRLRLKDWSGSTAYPAIRGTTLEDEREFYEPQSETYRVLMQYQVHHSE